MRYRISSCKREPNTKPRGGEGHLPASSPLAPRVISATVGEERGGVRADIFVAEIADLSRSRAAALIDGGSVTSSGGGKMAKNRKLRAGEAVTVTLPPLRAAAVEPEDIPLDIVYEDGDVIVINKPSGMVVHPAAGHSGGTLVNALLFRCGERLSGIGGEARPGIVHRLDRDTSGLMVAAKNDRAHIFLSEKLAVHDVRRVYFALVRGIPREREGRIELAICRDPRDRKKMAVATAARSGLRARHAVTNYRVLEEFSGISLVRFKLETGRTHQIRVHMAALGHPLLGDRVYGGGATPFERAHAKLFDGQCLHSGELSFEHPSTGEELHFTAPLPENFSRLLEILRSDGK